MHLGLGIRLGPMGGGASAPAFNPMTLTPSLWLDASDMTTLFQDSAGTVPVAVANDPVGRWADKSASARHLTQATGSARPSYRLTGGKFGIKGDGVDDGLAMAAAGAALSVSSDIFMVVANPDNDPSGVIFSNTSGVPYTLVYESGSTVSHDESSFGALLVNGTQYNGGGGSGSRGELYSAIGSTSNKVVEVRGINLSGITQPRVMAYGGFMSGMAMFELLICPTQTNAVRAQVRDYLTAKWGVA